MPAGTEIFFESGGGCALGIIPQAGVQRGGRLTVPRRFGQFALVYTLAGDGQYWDETGRERLLVSGDLIIVLPDLAHIYGALPDKTWDTMYVVFDGPVFRMWLKAGLLSSQRTLLQANPVDYWARRFRDLLKAADHTKAESASLVRVSKLQLLLSELLAQPTSPVDRGDQEWLGRACSMLREQSTASVDLTLVSRQLGVSYQTFRKRFRRLSGESPGHYHASYIIDKACSWLYETDLTVSEVAYRLGFCDPFHFSRRFKVHVGTSPSDFRRRLPLVPPATH